MRIIDADTMTSPANGDLLPIIDVSDSNALNKVTLATLSTFFGGGGTDVTEYITHTVAGAVAIAEKIALIYAVADITLPAIATAIYKVTIFAGAASITVSATGADTFYKGTSTAATFTLAAHNVVTVMNTGDGLTYWVPCGAPYALTGF